MKILLNIVGSIAVVLAILGIFLPLLPTTPFLLLASACYVRASDRMHRWLLNNRLFGSYLHNIENRKGLPLRAKVVTMTLMWASLLYSMYRFDDILVRAALSAIGIGVSIFLLRMKTLETVGESTERQ